MIYKKLGLLKFIDLIDWFINNVNNEGMEYIIKNIQYVLGGTSNSEKLIGILGNITMKFYENNTYG